MSNEAENVVAEVIEEQDASSLTVAYKPSVIEANFDALEAHVRKTVEAYDGATYDLTNLATVKNWPLIVTLVDLVWGTVLASAVSGIGYLAGTRFR